MRLDSGRGRELFAGAPVARLATVTADGRPHLVPIVFALTDRDVVYSAVDAKPKASTALRRLANIAANPNVCLLVDHYEDDWSRLWWVRADGTAQVHDPDGDAAAAAWALLVDRYPAYSGRTPPGPVIAVQVHRWSGWSAGQPARIPGEVTRSSESSE